MNKQTADVIDDLLCNHRDGVAASKLLDQVSDQCVKEAHRQEVLHRQPGAFALGIDNKDDQTRTDTLYWSYPSAITIHDVPTSCDKTSKQP